MEHVFKWYLRKKADILFGFYLQSAFYSFGSSSLVAIATHKFRTPSSRKHTLNPDPLKPHFYIVKLGFIGVYIIFLISAQNIDCGYSLEPPRRGGSNEYPQSMFWAEIWKYIRIFYLKTFSFWWWIFCIFEWACFRNVLEKKVFFFVHSLLWLLVIVTINVWKETFYITLSPRSVTESISLHYCRYAPLPNIFVFLWLQKILCHGDSLF